ncbi:MAG: LysM peptidoglycan-binding domain-containing protein [Planctomycetota bacterium]|nr:LysM peptidoglycan-binding domain-containing protein [Planctomycetota bacterium]
MQTIKTAVVVVLLLFVLYGGYIALNHREPELNPALQGLVDPDVFNADVDLPKPNYAPPSSPSASGAAPGNVSSAGNGPAPSNAFEAFAKNPNPAFSPPPPLSLPAPGPAQPTASPSNLGLEPPLPEIPSLELPNSPLPLEPPSLGTPVGTLMPKSSSPSLDPNVKPAAGTKSNDIPVLDLPSLHGNAKTMADATQIRNPEANLRNQTADPANTLAPRMPSSASGKSFSNAKRMALEQANAGKLKEALATLSVFYNAQDLTYEQQADLIDLLDALAREVIFSQRHLLDVPYVVNPGETLEQVAKTCNVPVSILAKINGLDEQSSLGTDRRLKVLQGPFRAEIVLDRNELTLFLGELYAGRYPVSFGNEPAARPGVYEVQDKQRDRNYYSANGMQIPAKDPRNPLGGYWIDLGEDLCIHGSAAVDSGAANIGCISLSPLDAGDVFGMLGRGCQVSIRK